jgi:hypothetical protein
MMYLAGIAVGSCVGFYAARISDAKQMRQQAQRTQAVIQELQALRGEMHTTQQELWRH